MEVWENRSLEDLENEIWKEIEEYNGDYFISNIGRIKSFKKYNGTDVRILEQHKDKDGYFYVGLWKNGEQKNKKIHRLMYGNHIEKIPEGYIIHHIDFTTNNILENFEKMTNEEHNRVHHKGLKHSEKTLELMGENNKGENNPNVILTERKVIEIRKHLGEGILTQKEIGAKFGVVQTTISDIKTGKIWKHIERENNEK